jgi:hypothetical protein
VKAEAQNAITESTAEAQRLRSEIERHEAKYAVLTTSLSEIKNSTSWRVTRPLRSLKRQLKAFLAIFNRII